jgi:hypothetical protein
MNIFQRCRVVVSFAALAGAAGFWSTPVCALTISLSYGPTLSAMIASSDPGALGLVSAATGAAGDWSSRFSDPITVKFSVDVEPMSSSVLGFFDVDAPGVTASFAYGAVKSALAGDISSPLDGVAVTSLQTGPNINMITNVTTDTPSFRKHFVPGITPGTDEFIFNGFLRVTRANQKALGLLAPAAGGAGADGTLKINSSILSTLDFDRSDGITGGTTDATAVLAHEMAHGLGFISGVDHMDFAGETGFFRGRPGGYGSDIDLTDEAIFTPLDLFRYSHDSITAASQPAGGGKALDWAFGASTGDPTLGPYFSVDGGTTNLGFLSTGAYNGDGFQAQHWKSDSLAPIFPGLPVGLMDPSIGFGELSTITTSDLRAMDAIGYNIAPVPEPSSIFMFVAVLPLLRRRRICSENTRRTPLGPQKCGCAESPIFIVC